MDIEQEIKELEKQITSLKEKQAKLERESAGNPHVFVPGDDERFWRVFQHPGDGKFEVTSGHNNNGKVTHGFRSEQAAKAWADMLNVMMELRVQPGACEWTEEEAKRCRVWTIVVDGEGVVCVSNLQPASGHTFGTFKTLEHAEAAIKAIGEERIHQAAYTLACKRLGGRVMPFLLPFIFTAIWLQGRTFEVKDDI